MLGLTFIIEMSKIARHNQRSFDAKERASLSLTFTFLSVLMCPESPSERPKLLLMDSCERENDCLQISYAVWTSPSSCRLLCCFWERNSFIQWIKATHPNVKTFCIIPPCRCVGTNSYTCAIILTVPLTYKANNEFKNCTVDPWTREELGTSTPACPQLQIHI